MNTDTTSINTVDQITVGITESLGSPSQGTPASTTQAVLMNIVLQMIEDGEIAFEALVKNFQDRPTPTENSTTPNDGKEKGGSIQVELMLGQQQLEAIAKEAGIPLGEVTTDLMRVLPLIVDKFTPDGKTPDPATVRQAASLLRTKIS